MAAIVTIRGADGRVRLYGLNPAGAWQRWRMGPGLVEWVADGPELPESASNSPTAGLDPDPHTRRAALWSVEPLHGLRQRWAELWPGWTLELDTGVTAEQIERIAALLRGPQTIP